MTDQHRSQYRLPTDLHDKLQHAARLNQRSVNAELVARLQASFDPPAAQEALQDLIENAVRRGLGER
ncbi:Arc family DNA-binding protein [Paucibacter sp. Y2R2-4]|uniref:Arc family DNA-binding protein n=1 Tax=Paucibacter sp. Y2R2-4 TaxID=2893553 RepID=UPI0021E42432|nr:Arc family DNA-binding protein [Paucibacter sp. Y2R2-4]MCV2349305.1 Arc family DNA-binding protein [Paucibacter sp. Y2R2-4]